MKKTEASPPWGFRMHVLEKAQMGTRGGVRRMLSSSSSGDVSLIIELSGADLKASCLHHHSVFPRSTKTEIYSSASGIPFPALRCQGDVVPSPVVVLWFERGRSKSLPPRACYASEISLQARTKETIVTSENPAMTTLKSHRDGMEIPIRRKKTFRTDRYRWTFADFYADKHRRFVGV